MVGFVVSTTATLKLQLPEYPASSVAPQETSLEPSANVELDGGEQPWSVIKPPQLSVPMVAAAKVAVALLDPVHSAVTLAGQVIGGGVRSTTVTVPVQELGLSQLLVGVTVNVTVVVPSPYGPGGFCVSVTALLLSKASVAIAAVA